MIWRWFKDTLLKLHVEMASIRIFVRTRRLYGQYVGFTAKLPSRQTELVSNACKRGWFLKELPQIAYDVPMAINTGVW